MINLFISLAALLSLIGGIVTLTVKDPFDKLITLSVLVSGIDIFMVTRGYLDVVIIVSLMMPIGVFFVLLMCRKKPEGLQ
jgi:energy-converting hydrogenase A subunit D